MSSDRKSTILDEDKKEAPLSFLPSLTEKQHQDIVAWIQDKNPESSLPLDLASVDLNSIPSQFAPNLACMAALFHAHEKLKKLVLAGANINQGDSHGITPLMYAVNFGTSQDVLEILKMGADPNLKDYWGTTPYLKSIILDDKSKIKHMEQYKAHIVLDKKYDVSDFRKLYSQLESQIIKEYQSAAEEKKPLLIFLAESHGEYESQIIQAMVIDIMYRLNIKKCYVEYLQGNQILYGQKNNLAQDIATHYKIPLKLIDINIIKSDSITKERVDDRNEGMKSGLLEPESGSGLVILGASHSSLGKSQEINKKFHVYNICTTNKVNKILLGSLSSWEYDNLSPVKEYDDFSFPDDLIYSKEIINFLKKIEKNKRPEQLHAIFTDYGIVKGVFHEKLTNLLSNYCQYTFFKPSHYIESSLLLKQLKQTTPDLKNDQKFIDSAYTLYKGSKSNFDPKLFSPLGKILSQTLGVSHYEDFVQVRLKIQEENMSIEQCKKNYPNIMFKLDDKAKKPIPIDPLEVFYNQSKSKKT